jgi:hypothetical protein
MAHSGQHKIEQVPPVIGSPLRSARADSEVHTHCKMAAAAVLYCPYGTPSQGCPMPHLQYSRQVQDWALHQDGLTYCRAAAAGLCRTGQTCRERQHSTHAQPEHTAPSTAA